VTERTARRLVRVLAVYLVIALVAAVWLTAGDLTSSIGDAPFIAMLAAGLTTFATIGLVIAAKAPYNPIGWLYAAGGIGMITSLTADEYAIRASTNLDVPGASYAQFLSTLIIVPSLGALTLALLLFPTGAPPSRRWRVVEGAIAASVAIGVVANALVPAVFEADLDIVVDNPFHITALASLGWLGDLWGVTMTAAGLAAFASVGVRYWRSRGEERQQIRWLAFAVALCLASVVLLLVSGDSALGNVAFAIMLLAFVVGLPVATAFAILRYRLYDLDLVIKKTVVFAITVVLVMATGLGILLLISSPLTDLAPDETQAVGLTSLVIGALVWPLWHLARRIGDRVVYGGRATPYEALTEFSDRLSEAYATDDVLPRMAAVLGESTRAAEARVWLRVGNVVRPVAAWPSDAAALAPIATTGDALPDLPADRAVEVRHRGELLGVLSAVSRANDPIDAGRTALMRDLAAQAGLVLRNVRLIEELRASRQRLVAAQDEERRRLERNIHDGAQQQLVALGVKLRLADTFVDRAPPKAHELMSQLQDETQAAIDDLRDLARGIYPPLLADRGLEAALDAQARKSPTSVAVSAAGLERYDQDIEAAVYFACLEALQNVTKYAAATHASIELAQRNGSLEFVVIDDGSGFDPANVTLGSGLQGMTDRIDAIGGRLTIESEPGGGTTVRGSVPV